MHLHFWPEEQVLTEGAQGGLAVSPLSLNLSLSESAVKTDDVSPDLCETSPLSRVQAQMVPVVQHQLQTYTPGGLTPRISEMALKALQSQNNQVFKVCFFQCLAFSKYRFLQRCFCLAILRCALWKTLPGAYTSEHVEHPLCLRTSMGNRDISFFFFLLSWN